MILNKITYKILFLIGLSISSLSDNSVYEETIGCCCCDYGLSLLCECLTDQDDKEFIGKNAIIPSQFKDVDSIKSGNFYSSLAIWRVCISYFSTVNKSSILYRSRYATRSQVLLI